MIKMENNKIYYCPKCNSQDIEFICLNPPEPDMISIDDMPTIHTITRDLVLRQYEHQAKCKTCGHIVKYMM